MRFLKRAFEAWPYLCIAISTVGLLYIAMNPSR